jgi:hypothetical protein
MIFVLGGGMVFLVGLVWGAILTRMILYELAGRPDLI